MLECWNLLAIENGFDGIYYVETLRDNSQSDESLFAAAVEFEPARSLTPSNVVLWMNRIRRYLVYFYNRLSRTHHLCNRILPFSKVAKKSLSFSNTRNTFGGLFMGWDNTPRKKELGTIVEQPTKKEFEMFVEAKCKQVIQSNDSKNRFIFINAWNEWAEGTYLEPDISNQYKYLEVIREYAEKMGN